jgi:hypothetical protein
MAQIKVKEIKGPLGNGDKKFFAAVDDKGVEYTTFDTAILSVTPGSIIEAEIVIKPGKGGKTYINLADGWKVISAAAAAAPAPGPSGGTAGPHAPVDPGTVLLEIDARARSTALILAGDLAKNGKITPDGILSWANTFYAWLKVGAAKSAPVPAAAAGPPKSWAAAGKSDSEKSTEELEQEIFGKKGGNPPRDPLTVRNLGELFQACKDDFNMMPDAVAKELGYSNRENLVGGNVADYYRTIVQSRS